MMILVTWAVGSPQDIKAAGVDKPKAKIAVIVSKRLFIISSCC
jgi:hypothetical protein